MLDILLWFILLSFGLSCCQLGTRLAFKLESPSQIKKIMDPSASATLAASSSYQFATWKCFAIDFWTSEYKWNMASISSKMKYPKVEGWWQSLTIENHILWTRLSVCRPRHLHLSHHQLHHSFLSDRSTPRCFDCSKAISVSPLPFLAGAGKPFSFRKLIVKNETN